MDLYIYLTIKIKLYKINYMLETFKVKCPNCDAILIINRSTGEVVEVRKPLIEESTGDRFKDAFEKYKKDKLESEEKIKEQLEYEKEKKEKLEQLFKSKLNEIKKEEK